MNAPDKGWLDFLRMMFGIILVGGLFLALLRGHLDQETTGEIAAGLIAIAILFAQNNLKNG